jgi:hypothetical protein
MKDSTYRNASSTIGIARSILLVIRLIPLEIDRSDGSMKMVLAYAHPLNYCVKLMSSFCSFSFIAVVHYTMLDLKVCEKVGSARGGGEHLVDRFAHLKYGSLSGVSL